MATGRDLARDVRARLRGRRLRLALILLLFLVQAATALVFPFVVGDLVDTITLGGTADDVWWWLTLLAAAPVVGGVFTWLGVTAMGRLVETMISELREDYVGAALRLPRDTMERAGAGDAVTRASDDVAEVSDALPQALPRIVVSATTLVIVGVGLGGVNVWYLAAFAVTIPVYALTARWYLRIAPPIYLAERAASSRRGAHLLGGIQALPTVHAHRLEGTQLARIGGAAWESVRWAMRARIVQNRLFGRLSVAEGAGLVLVLGIGVWLALTGRATPGAVTAAALLLLRIVEPIEALLMIMDDMQSAIAALGRLVGVIGRSDGASDAADGEAVDDVDTREEGREARPDLVVDVQDVGFAYDDDAEPALRDVTLGMAAGEHVAIVGATGSGKSTLASLIAGVFEPTRGQVRRRLPRRSVVTLTQEVHLFSGTVEDNLTLARPGATRAEITAALRLAGAWDVVQSLDDGLDTVIGAGGTTLSSADAQHLALARLALADPGLAILDEATAEAGSADTSALEEAAGAVIDGRAAVVIAHRLSQAAAADRVVVLDRGAVVEQGSHETLLAAGGTYRRLWDAWSA
ncbi:ABC transporter, transmembrane region:ABC transporter [Actinomycetales bacterium JB111]|nr:ABC transporter, transmembrane region:ABC transporter [Actinomycetales bacterium JB111]